MKKFLSVFLCFIIVLTLFNIIPLTAFAIESGTTGDCTWTRDGTELTISGTGAMGGYYVTATLPWGKGITKVTIESGVTSIGYYAFSGCTSLTSVSIGNSVTTIGEYAFKGCYKLTSIEIPDSVTTIGGGAFSGCTSLASIEIPDTITSIGYQAFKDCTSLASIEIPDSVTSIGSSAFYNTAYYNTSSNWENDVLYIGNYLINAKNTLSGNYTIKDGTKCIAGYAFSGCKLVSIEIPDSVTSIGGGAFMIAQALQV